MHYFVENVFEGVEKRMSIIPSNELTIRRKGLGTVPVKHLLLSILALLFPAVNEIYFNFQVNTVKFAYLVPAFILSYYLGIKGGFYTVIFTAMSSLSAHVVLWFLGKGRIVDRWLEELAGLGGILVFSLVVGHFAEKMLARNKLLEMANAELQRLALTDELTRLYNHRYFQMRLEEELQRAGRHGAPLSLIMLDVDFFKQYNDTHGHPMGDQLLKGLSQLLCENVRVMDTVARYGGEEFAIILTDTTGEQAVQVADRIRSAIQDYPFPGRESQPGGIVTVSVGIASYPQNASTREELVQRADEALYQAKRETRNTVQLSFTISEDKSHLRLIKG